ncbi:hypothetical protein MVEN_00219700 [Mycena venus]|uniref:SET domain-containing protein n=1 Tax=Mycena venus TaxID=2733690 RepID=A0A8H7DC30_9AGAR|nr:hypothetical protein MVEN_00219700 [Mycena venus]
MGITAASDADVIVLDNSPEPDTPKPKPIYNSNEIFEISDSDSESEKVKKTSAGRKAQKQKEAPLAPLDRDIVEIPDSDDEPALPAHTVEKNEPGFELSLKQTDGFAALPSLPDPVKNDLDLDLGDADDGMELGGEDLSLANRSPGRRLDLPEMPDTSSNGDLSDRRSQPPQQRSNNLSVTNPPPPIVLTHNATQSSLVPDNRPEVPSLTASAIIPDVGPADKRFSSDELAAEELVSSLRPPLNDQSISDSNELAKSGMSLDERSPLSPQSSRAFRPSNRSESSSDLSHSLTYGPLFQSNHSTDPDLPENDATRSGDVLPSRALPSPPSPQVVSLSKPQSKSRPVPRTRPSLPIVFEAQRPAPVPSTSASSVPSSQSASTSPYKSIRDTALRTPAEALQQDLGLPVRGKAPALPKLDFSSLPMPPRSLPKKQLLRRRTPPRSLLLDPDPVPATEPQAEESTTSQRSWTPPRSLLMDQDVAPTPATRLQSEQTTALQRGPSAPLSPRPQVKKPKPQSSATSISTSAQNQWDQKSLVDAIIATGQHNAQSSALSHSFRPLPKRAQASIPPVDQQTPPAPPPPADHETEVPSARLVKLEEARHSSGSNASLISHIIDLTLSDDEEPKIGASHQVQAQSAPQGSSGSEQVIPPIGTTRVDPTRSIEEIRMRNAKRLKKLLTVAEGSVLAGAAAVPVSGSTLQISTASAPAVLEGPRGSMNEDTTTPSLSGVGLFEPGDLRRSLAPVLAHEAEMAVDETPPPLKSPSVPELDATAMIVSLLRRHIIMNGEVTMMSRCTISNILALSAPVGPTPADPEEAAVEDLVAPASGTPSQGDTDAISERAPSSVTPSERDFLEASDDENVSASPQPPLRRLSRRSSMASSRDPLDLLGNDSENNPHSRSISPIGMLDDDSVPLSPVSMADDFFHDIDDTVTSVEPATATQYPIITWQSYKQDPSNFQPRVYYAKNLVSKLHDYIHSYGESFRMLPHLRTVFESAMRENTADDEPDAPWIEVVNEVDDEPAPPWEFYYTNKLWLGDGVDPPDMSQLVGCDCKGRCDPKSKTCSCLQRQNEYLKGYIDPGFAYDHKGRLRTDGTPIFECNSLCACDDDECRNRVVQHGRKCHVAIKKTVDKGWGVFATKRIHKGTFVGLYSGEFLRDDICERRGLVYDKSGRTYLMNLDWYYLKELNSDIEYTVDAYHAGNFTRFLNHSCEPNCKVQPCYIDEPDIMKSLVTLFASKDIAAGEELSFSYDGYDPDKADNDDEDEDNLQGSNSMTKNKCFCKAARCRGFMFG